LGKQVVKKKRATITAGSAEHHIISEAVAKWAKRRRLDPAAKADKAYMAPFVQRGVAESTLRKYLNGALSLKKERRGPPPLIDPSLARVTADSLASADNGNRGLSRKAAIATLAGARGLSPKQAGKCWDRRVKRDAVEAGIIKNDTVSAALSARSEHTLHTPARIKKLRAILELAATIDAAKSMSAKANTEKAAETVESLIKKHAPTGMAHLRADWDAVGVLTANQISRSPPSTCTKR